LLDLISGGFDDLFKKLEVDISICELEVIEYQSDLLNVFLLAEEELAHFL